MNDIRCLENRYNTLLFRYDSKGIYVWCKDCRDPKLDKKGTQHLISWAALHRMEEQTIAYTATDTDSNNTDLGTHQGDYHC